VKTVSCGKYVNKTLNKKLNIKKALYQRKITRDIYSFIQYLWITGKKSKNYVTLSFRII
jgi:hypothetical protein